MGAISGAEHQFPRETEVVPLIIGQGSLSEVENALVLAAEVEEGHSEAMLLLFKDVDRELETSLFCF